MLQYLIILLDEASVAYCQGGLTPAPSPAGEGREGLMPLDVLRRGIVFAMKENLNIQFIYPERPLPAEYEAVIESIDHTKIKPEAQADGADVVVLTTWKDHIADAANGSTCILHASRTELQEHLSTLKELLTRVMRLNIVLTDVGTFKDKDAVAYGALLDEVAETIVAEWQRGHVVQLNVLTDRLQLSEMNNCGAGDTNVTLAPDGRFYLCPAFYYDDAQQSVGDLHAGLNIPNRQLLRLDHAPICRHCDAFQCRRCVWMNTRMTLDANTPSHEQCVVAHVERNASRKLRQKLQAAGIRLEGSQPIPELDYLDPFNNYKLWK